MTPSKLWAISSYIWAAGLMVWGFVFGATLESSALLMVVISGLMVLYSVWRARL